MVVVHVGHRPALVPVDAHRHLTHHVGLEMEHHVAPDEGVLEPGQHQQARGLQAAGGQDHVAG